MAITQQWAFSVSNSIVFPIIGAQRINKITPVFSAKMLSLLLKYIKMPLTNHYAQNRCTTRKITFTFPLAECDNITGPYALHHSHMTSSKGNRVLCRITHLCNSTQKCKYFAYLSTVEPHGVTGLLSHTADRCFLVAKLAAPFPA